MNLSNRAFIRHACLGFLLSACLGVPPTATAAPGTLSQIPLFLASGAEPNIFFVLDDSGSMGSDVLKSKGAEQAHPVSTDEDDLDNDGDTDEVLFDVDGNMVSAPERVDQVLEHCVGYNLMAYDPTVTYSPWEGVDENGNEYGDLTIFTARNNPYFATSTFIGFEIYFPWDDADGDGEYDVGECPRPDPADYGGSIEGDVDCPAAGGCKVAGELDADEQTNFANWYSYYRKRAHVQKRAVSSVIDSSSARMGMASLQDNSWIAGGSVATPISDMSDTSSASDCGAGISNRDCLLQRLSQIRSLNATPLRRALDQAGIYFDQTDGLDHEYLGATAPSPLLTEEEGGGCQQNFVILVSDGFWNQPWPTVDSAGQTMRSHGDADTDGDSEWDGGAQADGDPPPGDGDCIDRLMFGWTDPFTKDTLADIAMHYYETDLSDTLPDNVGPRKDIDENRQQHLVTFTVAFGVDGSMTDADVNPLSDRATPIDWPPVCYDEFWTVDDMRHAAWNSRGEFLSAGNPTTIGTAITDAVATASDRVPTAAAEFNTGNLSTDTLIFLTKGDSTDWSGDLEAYDAEELLADIGSDGTIDTTTPAWSAAAELDALDNTQALDRVVLTRGASGDGVAAVSWVDLSPAQQEDFKTDTSGNPGEDDAGQARLEYLLGDRSCEVAGAGTCARDVNGDSDSVADDDLDKSLRKRASRLGDIFGSVPLVVGVPTTSWPSTAPFPTAAGETFADFKADLIAAPRMEVVYVGANDGMLHGFNAETGREVLAYLPASLASTAINAGYHYLSDPRYSHRFYVDRTPTVNHAYIAASHGGTAAWRTLAVGALGAGGRGLYALDINEPAGFTLTNAADILLWEFTEADDEELGFTLSEPTIVMMNNGEWAAIVGSGYNDTGADPDAHLFILFLEGGLDGIWTEGTDYIRIEAPDATATVENRNGMSSPKAADLDGNGTTDRVYAGDLFGNLWAFDVSAASPSDWGVAKDSGGGSRPLFTAEIRAGEMTRRQPITGEPVIAKHPTQSDLTTNQPNVMVYFGTGQYLTEDDLKTTDTQSFYGVWDRGALSLTRANLLARTFDPNFANNTVLTDTPSVDWTTQFGWYIDLPNAGERAVTDPALRSGIVFFNSLIPSTNLCSGGGSGFQYTVDMEDGGPPDRPAFDFNNSGSVDSTDVATGTNEDTENPSRVAFAGEVPTASVFLDDTEFTGSSDGEVLAREVIAIGGTGRLSWQELMSF